MINRPWWTYPKVVRRMMCIRAGHPMADWSPITTIYKAPDKLGPDGTIIEGDEVITRQWRCALHDRERADWG
jgi:hypothetical protein